MCTFAPHQTQKVYENGNKIWSKFANVGTFCQKPANFCPTVLPNSPTLTIRFLFIHMFSFSLFLFIVLFPLFHIFFYVTMSPAIPTAKSPPSTKLAPAKASLSKAKAKPKKMHDRKLWSHHHWCA